MRLLLCNIDGSLQEASFAVRSDLEYACPKVASHIAGSSPPYLQRLNL